MTKYEKLNAMILSVIGEAPVKLSAMYFGPLRAECERIAREIAKEWPFSRRIPESICRDRLQALRKAGKIRSTSRGWVRVGEAS